MNKPKLKAIRFGTNDVIATSSKFNGFHLVNIANGNLSDNALYKVTNGVEESSNCLNNYTDYMNDYYFKYDNDNQTLGSYFESSYNEGQSSFEKYNGYYTFDGNRTFTYQGTDMPTKQ